LIRLHRGRAPRGGRRGEPALPRRHRGRGGRGQSLYQGSANYSFGGSGLDSTNFQPRNGIVTPETVVLTTSVDALLMTVLGGAGTLVGGAIGSAIVFGLREYVSTLVPWWQYVLGGVYVLTILYLPTGLMGIPGRISQWRNSQKKRETTKMASAPS